MAVSADPWRGPYTVWRGGEGLGDEAIATLSRPSLMGRTTTPLWRRPAVDLEPDASVTVELVTGVLSGQPEAAVLSGANALALRHPGEGWEVLQFRDAALVASGPIGWDACCAASAARSISPAPSRPGRRR